MPRQFSSSSPTASLRIGRVVVYLSFISILVLFRVTHKSFILTTPQNKYDDKSDQQFSSSPEADVITDFRNRRPKKHGPGEGFLLESVRSKHALSESSCNYLPISPIQTQQKPLWIPVSSGDESAAVCLLPADHTKRSLMIVLSNTPFPFHRELHKHET